MNTIQIVTNSDRCHVSVNHRPVATFMYSDSSKEEALHNAMAQTFITLSECRAQGIRAVINTEIVSK